MRGKLKIIGVRDMKAVYLADSSKNLKLFICGIKDGDDCYSFCGVGTVFEKAFASSDIKQVVFEDTLAKVKEEAFKDCEELRIFCCGKVCGDEDAEKTTGVIKGIEIYESKVAKKSEFIIETSAFAGCDKLHTVILPQCETLKIEKNAFDGCSSLRTVVALTDKIELTENPFNDCPKDLTFVCKSNSDIERFARENGYRY